MLAVATQLKNPTDNQQHSNFPSQLFVNIWTIERKEIQEVCVQNEFNMQYDLSTNFIERNIRNYKNWEGNWEYFNLKNLIMNTKSLDFRLLPVL